MSTYDHSTSPVRSRRRGTGLALAGSFLIGDPMGRAKILWNPPYYTVHGTEDEHSLGEAASHGSIRVSKPVVRERGEVPIPDPIPFIVRE